MNTKKITREQHNYRSELTITALLLSGVGLLYTDIPFHIMVQTFIQRLGDATVSVKQFLVSIFIEPFVQLEFSDIVGILMIVISLGLMIVQIRKRMISSSYESHSCPLCDSKLHRVHRSRWQLWLSKALYLSSGYFHCDTCDHSSLRFYQKTPHLHRG
ncbi:MAG: hypothetical protein H8E26_07390 [FCB group bacterium]|nr:hypothetical protein [FCB group bacterium]MBL7029087.1 hypothetical protein [Candidatus Neomarinimicrobiota bacterium]MBL7122567.1 hypothetical protein [Candidatus Neomarinimicrobiota bacterium]